MLGKDSRQDEGTLAIARAIAEPAPHHRPVQLGKQEEPFGRLALSLLRDRAGRLVRQQDAADVNPGFEVRVTLGSADVDHEGPPGRRTINP
jgi:hypothetical protein